MAEIAAARRGRGRDAAGPARRIAARFGRHVIAERSVRMDAGRGGGGGACAAGATRPPRSAAGPVLDVEAYPEADLLRFELEGGVRVQMRPSGTEPKVKLYGEAVDDDPAPFVKALGDLLS